jgi:aryl-alcohol dehydrogenase-like predicted oxidoreductase
VSRPDRLGEDKEEESARPAAPDGGRAACRGSYFDGLHSGRDDMDRRGLGKSGVEVTVVTFGAWAIGGWMWGGQDEDDAVAAIHAAIDEGMTSIDTAAIYGYGYSEEVVGKAIAGKRDSVQLLTKYGLRWDDTAGVHHFDWTDEQFGERHIYKNARRASVIHECEQSLRRLKTDHIDLYQCHWRDESTPVEETMSAMDRLIKDGKIRAAGVSNFSVDDLAECTRHVALASDQPPYSMVNRGIEGNVLPWCRENGVGVVVYSPLQRGLLTGKITEDYEFGEGDHRANDRFFRPGNVKKVNAMLARLRPVAEAHDATFAQLAIAWAIAQPGVTAALVGARNARQAKENARAASITLSDEEVATINSHLDGLQLDV